MTKDWTSIPDDSLIQGAPPRATVVTALRDNPIALAEGAEDAPRIQGDAIGRDFAGSYLPVVSVGAGDVTVQQGAGAAFGDLTTSSTSFVVAATYRIRSYSGTMRFRASHRMQEAASNFSIQLRLVKNGSVVNTFTLTNSTGAIPRVLDAAVAPGDVFTWEHRLSNGAPQLSTVSLVTVSGDVVYIEQPAYVLSSRSRDAL